jgi:hypothetical protein
LAVSVGVCIAGGRTGTVATAFGLAPAVGVVICAFAELPAATNIKVAASHDLMTNPGVIEYSRFKHICLVGNRRAVVQAPVLEKANETGSSLRAKRSNPFLSLLKRGLLRRYRSSQ